jgi:O-antigen ligase
LLAVLITALVPGFAFTELGYRGFMYAKNPFGQFTLLAILAGGFLVLRQQSFRAIWGAVAALGVMGLVLSRSVTSVGVALIAVAALGIVHWFRRRPRMVGAMALIAGMMTLLASHALVVVFGPPEFWSAVEAVTRMTGKDATLSGRTYLWELMWRHIQQHPWFGVGYGGFWLGASGDSGQVAYWVKWGYPGQAHNGYLDILNEVGFVGLSLLVAALILYASRLAQLLMHDVSLGYFHVMVLLVAVGLNFTEASLLRTTNLWWLVIVCSMVEVDKLVMGMRRRSELDQLDRTFMRRVVA